MTTEQSTAGKASGEGDESARGTTCLLAIMERRGHEVKPPGRGAGAIRRCGGRYRSCVPPPDLAHHHPEPTVVARRRDLARHEAVPGLHLDERVSADRLAQR